MEKRCPCCGKTFECRHHDILSCQCTQIHLSAKELAYIDALYPGCLCLQCLKDLKTSFYKQGLDEIEELLTPNKSE
uniref:cysteine-rich CWC family protein n=1 Tax=Dysgonomonas sp. TaxID=1891233 RepID=UPI0039E69961